MTMNQGYSDYKRFLLYTFIHCVVDFTCCFFIIRMLDDIGGMTTALLCYNFCAFALQMPLGILADRMRCCTWLSVIGTGELVLLYVGVCNGGWIQTWPLLFACGAGVGNALFHIGCGTQVLRRQKRTRTSVGIFVCSGALGLFWGRFCATQNIFAPIVQKTSIVGTVLAFVLLSVDASLERKSTAGDLGAGHLGKYEVCKKRILITSVTAFFGVIALRSYLGLVVFYPWGKKYAFAIVCGVSAGKMIGGLLSDYYREDMVVCISLLLAAGMFLLSQNPFFGVSALILFNITMPITLCAISRVLRMPGIAFGMMTFVLYLGYLPAFLKRTDRAFCPRFYAAVTLLSLALMALGYASLNRTNEKEHIQSK